MELAVEQPAGHEPRGERNEVARQEPHSGVLRRRPASVPLRCQLPSPHPIFGSRKIKDRTGIGAARRCFTPHQHTPAIAWNMASPETDGPLQVNGEAGNVESTPTAVNGTVNGTSQPYTPPRTDPASLPRTPSLTSFSLTEYSARPSPPSEDKTLELKKIVPDDLLLPNGHPDVSHPRPPPLAPSHALPMTGAVSRSVDTLKFGKPLKLGHSTSDSSSPLTPASERCARRRRSFRPSA